MLPQIATFTKEEASWFSQASPPGNHVLIARFRAQPGARPTIHLPDHTLLAVQRVASSIEYIDQIISKYLLSEEHYDNYACNISSESEDLISIFQVHDGMVHIPGTIGYCAKTSDMTLIPDTDFWIQRGYFNRRREFKRAWVPWQDRIQLVFWRGSSTGGPPKGTMESFVDLPRFRLCSAGAKGRNLYGLLDAKLTKIVQISSPDETERIRRFLESGGLLSTPVPQTGFLKYRFQIDIDGNSNSWSFLLKLLMGSCVLKVMSEWRQWYYGDLIAWKHFVPVQNDLSDLEERVMWCMENDDEAREIAEAGRKFANGIVFGTEMPKAAAAVLNASRPSLNLLPRQPEASRGSASAGTVSATAEEKAPRGACFTGLQVMHKLYGCDIWNGFAPSPAASEVQGWNGTHPSLERLATAFSNIGTVIIDVGVWKGQSTITMANAMRRAGIDGCVIAVDTFLGSPEHWSGRNALFSRVNGLPDLYKTFLSNVYTAELTRYIVPMPQSSTSAATILGALQIAPCVVHLDAAHEYEDVMRDATAYWRLLKPGGYLIGDDYHESWPGVIKAAGEFSAKVGRPLTIEPPKWILQKPG